MKRRELVRLACGAAAVRAFGLRAARAEPPTIPVVGFLGSESPALFDEQLRLFRKGLGDAGFVEGRNVAIEYRWAKGQNDLLPKLAADLVRRQVTVIVAPQSTPAALAAKAATSTIPIVIFTAGDPVALGLVASLDRPGGNVTGVASLGRDLAPKRLELLHDILPKATVLGLLVNPSNPALTRSTIEAAEAAAHTLGLELEVFRASRDRDFESVFAGLARARASGLVIAIDSFFTGRRKRLAALALDHAVPAIYQYRDFAAAGGVMSYGGNLEEPFRLISLYTARLLNGERPADLPIELAAKIELIVNVKAANSLKISVPPLLLSRADEVIE